MYKYLHLLGTISFIFIFTFNAYAEIDWKDSPFKNLSSNVQTVKDAVTTGNISTVADEFQEQVTLLQKNGYLLHESAVQLLTWLNDHRQEYLDFVDGNKCGSGSPCDTFRNDLITFVQAFSSLSEHFPMIKKVGLSDAPLLTRMIKRLPPVLLFPMHESMSRMQGWRDLPAQLKSIYDEIGDPDVFSDRLLPLPEADIADFAPSSFTTTALSGPSERFCEKQGDRLDNGIDPVRLNRIKLFLSSGKSAFTIVAEFLPEDQSLNILGEGGSFKVPAAPALKGVAEVIGLILEAVDTFHNNLAICDAERDRLFQLEVRVAQCLQLADFILPGTREEIYNIVDEKIYIADIDYGMPVDKSNRAMDRAREFRADGMWKEAYLKLCDAYRKIGE